MYHSVWCIVSFIRIKNKILACWDVRKKMRTFLFNNKKTHTQNDAVSWHAEMITRTNWWILARFFTKMRASLELSKNKSNIRLAMNRARFSFDLELIITFWLCYEKIWFIRDKWYYLHDLASWKSQFEKRLKNGIHKMKIFESEH